MIRKIIWPHMVEKGNPFGGKNGDRSLSLTFHSKVYKETSPEELKALEILYEICGVNHVDIMSFDGKVYPKIVFGKPDDVESNAITVINEDEQPIRFSGIYSSRISKDQIIWIMGVFSSNRQHEFDIAREEIIQVEAHYALHRDIFVTTSSFLIKNRDKLNESNILTPLEALKIVGLYIRYQNEHEWVSEVKGKARFLASSHMFFEYLARGLLPNNWRFLHYISSFLEDEDERYLGISIVNRCSSALQARDELAKLFYMPGEYGSSDKRKYHFDYLTLLLAGALDSLALILNRVYNLELESIDCSLSPSRNKFKRKLSVNPDSSMVFEYIESTPVKLFLEILYLLRNKIHSISLDESMSVPQDSVEALLDKIYDYDNANHWGVTKQKVMAYINKKPPVPHYEIKINKYFLACELLSKTFEIINQVMDLVTPESVVWDPPSDMMMYIERYKYLG